MKRKFAILLNSILLISISTSFILGNTLYAQTPAQSEGIILSPPAFTENIEAGASVSQVFKVVNQREGRDTFTVYSREVSIAADGSFYTPEEYVLDQTSRFEKEGWLTFSPKTFTIDKGVTQEILVTLNMPSDLPTGGYYVELSVAATDPSLDFGVGTVPEVAIPIVINFFGVGEPSPELQILTFEHENKFSHIIYEYLPVRFFTTLLNIGNLHIVPVGQIFISHDPEFNEVDINLPFNRGRNRVLVGARRFFENTWTEGMLTYEDEQLNLNAENPFRIGRYFAQLSITWDDVIGKQFATAVVEFWVIPWKLILALVIIIVTQYWLVKNYLKNRRTEKRYVRGGYYK